MVDRRYGTFVWAIVAFGLGLRIAAAQGGLWLDEAWSAAMAHQVGTPREVLFGINHDNNHHINSLWLQAVGYAAPPLLQRALSIATGTIGIAVAAKILRPHSRGVSLIAAALFAVSPMLVTMGSEARGYASMTLALLTAILLLDRWLVAERGERMPFRLGLCFFLGAFSQLTMGLGCVALVGWVYLALAQRHDAWIAARRALVLFAVPLIAIAVVIGVVGYAASLSTAGFQFGNYVPFRTDVFLGAMADLVGFTVGWPVGLPWAIVPAFVLAIVAWRTITPRRPFYRLAVLGLPLSVMLLHVGNSGYPRYYLLTAIALLLLIAEVTGAAVAKPGWHRWAALAALTAMLLGGLWQDADLIRNQRGDPDPAIAALRQRAPAGAVVLLDRWTGRALLAAAAAHARYPLRLVAGGCPPARFLFADRWKGETLPPAASRCGARWDAIAAARAHGLSGTHWTLYARRF